MGITPTRRGLNQVCRGWLSQASAATLALPSTGTAPSGVLPPLPLLWTDPVRALLFHGTSRGGPVQGSFQTAKSQRKVMGMKIIWAPGFPHLHLFPYFLATVLVTRLEGVEVRSIISGPHFNVSAAFCQSQASCPVGDLCASVCLCHHCLPCHKVASTPSFLSL